MAPAARYTPEEQEQLIILAAAKVIEQSSLLGFKMSDIAKQAGISMGSIYKHVQTKEDVLIALATEYFKHLAVQFKKISDLLLTTPERYLAYNLIDKQKNALFPFQEHLEMLISNDAIISNGSDSWKAKMYAADKALEDQCHQQSRLAIESGELQVPVGDDNYSCKFHLGMWAISVGFTQVSLQLRGKNLFNGMSLDDGVYQADSLQVQSIKTYINAFDWREPLTDEGIDNTIIALQQIGLR